MWDKVIRFGASPWYWLGLAVLGLSMEALALVYQYKWNYGPCVHCIHVRIWLLGMIVVGFQGLFFRKWRITNALLHAVNGGLMYGMLLTSQQLLGTERGTIFGTCSFDSGLPSWFALDKWFPAIFEAKEACGYTPKLAFGITMAEALVAFSWIMLILSAVLMVTSLARKRQ